MPMSRLPWPDVVFWAPLALAFIAGSTLAERMLLPLLGDLESALAWPIGLGSAMACAGLARRLVRRARRPAGGAG